MLMAMVVEAAVELLILIIVTIMVLVVTMIAIMTVNPGTGGVTETLDFPGEGKTMAVVGARSATASVARLAEQEVTEIMEREVEIEDMIAVLTLKTKVPHHIFAPAVSGVLRLRVVEAENVVLAPVAILVGGQLNDAPADMMKMIVAADGIARLPEIVTGIVIEIEIVIVIVIETVIETVIGTVTAIEIVTVIETAIGTVIETVIVTEIEGGSVTVVTTATGMTRTGKNPLQRLLQKRQQTKNKMTRVRRGHRHFRADTLVLPFQTMSALVNELLLFLLFFSFHGLLLWSRLYSFSKVLTITTCFIQCVCA